MTIGHLRDTGEPCSLPALSHAAVFGATGTGKTNTLERICLDAVERGHGLTVLDPHGGLVDRLLDLIPADRTNDIILLDPTASRVPGLDLLEAPDPALGAEQVAHVFRSLWSESWGPRSEWLLQGFLLAISGRRASIATLHRALRSKRFRAELSARATPEVADFIATVEGWTPRFREEALGPLVNKVGRLVLNPHARLVLGQATPSFTFAEVLAGKILLCRLPKGALGDASPLLGSLVVSKLLQAALGSGPDADRTPHLLACDEVQNFVHGVDLATGLAESRKYGLRLLLATQNLSQLDPATRGAVYGNCGSLVSFRVSGEDAAVLAREIAPEMRPQAFQDLPNYECRVRAVLDGVPAGTLYVRASGPLPSAGRAAVARREALRRHARPRGKVERRIARHLRKR